jgi:hypothetical protein
VVSVFATGPKVCGFEPGQGDGLLRAINIRSTPYSRMGSECWDSTLSQVTTASFHILSNLSVTLSFDTIRIYVYMPSLKLTKKGR